MPSRTTRAVFGCRPMSALMAAPVWPLARASSRLPSRMSVMMNAAESKYIGTLMPWCSKKPGKSTPSHAVEVGGRRAHRDQRVHGRRAVLQRRPGRRVELPAHPELHDARERPEEVAVVHPGGQEREPLHLHRAGEDDDAEHEADGDLELEPAVGGGAGGLFGVCRRLDALLAGAGRRLDDVVAGAAHGLHQVLVARLAGDVRDGRLLRRQIDLGLEDAGWHCAAPSPPGPRSSRRSCR